MIKLYKSFLKVRIQILKSQVEIMQSHCNAINLPLIGYEIKISLTSKFYKFFVI